MSSASSPRPWRVTERPEGDRLHEPVERRPVSRLNRERTDMHLPQRTAGGLSSRGGPRCLFRTAYLMPRLVVSAMICAPQAARSQEPPAAVPAGTTQAPAGQKPAADPSVSGASQEGTAAQEPAPAPPSPYAE